MIHLSSDYDVDDTDIVEQLYQPPRVDNPGDLLECLLKSEIIKIV